MLTVLSFFPAAATVAFFAAAAFLRSTPARATARKCHVHDTKEET